MPKREKPEEEGIGFGLGLGGLFKGIGNLINLVSEMEEEGVTEVSRTGEIKGLGKAVKVMYGFTVKMGAGGTPVVSQFGNIRATEKGAVVEEVREPVVDVFDEEDRVLVITELPGVEESDINIEVKDDIVFLSAEGKDAKYAKEVLLPRSVDDAKTQSSYKNGVLEIIFSKVKG